MTGYALLLIAGTLGLFVGWALLRYRWAPWLALAVTLALDNRLRFGPVSFTIGELGALTFMAVMFLRIDVTTWRFRRNHVFLFLLMIMSMVVAWGRDPDAIHAFSAMRDALEPILLFIVIVALPQDEVPLNLMITSVIVVACLAASLGIAQFAFDTHVLARSDYNLVWESEKLQSLEGYLVARWLGLKGVLATGTYSGPNTFAEFLFFSVVASAGMVIFRRELEASELEASQWRWTYYVMACAFLTLALTMTFGRTVSFLVPCSWILLLLAKGRRLSPGTLVLVTIAVIATGIIVVQSGLFEPQQVASVGGRRLMLASALRLLSDHPGAILGGAIPLFLQQYYEYDQPVHHIVLYFVLQYGLLMALSFLAVIVKVVAECTRATTIAEAGLPRAIAAIGSVAVFSMVFLYGQTAPYLDSVQSGLSLWVWAALGVVASRRSVRRNTEHLVSAD